MKTNTERVLSIINDSSVKTLNPVQQQAMKKGVMEGKNIVVSSPTASGKTLIAEMAMLNNFMDGGKAVYITPLKSIAAEKYAEFNEKYKSLGMKIAVSVGDFDSAEEWLGNYHVIITTSEKLDAIMRHKPDWISKLTLVVVDEIHLLNDPSRGPTLEVVITKLRLLTNSQLVALSATINNSMEISKWLNANLVESDYRPVKLNKGIFYPHTSGNILEFSSGDNIEMEPGEPDTVLAGNSIKKGKQCIVFVSSRKGSEACAERVGKTASKMLTEGDRMELRKISATVRKALHSPTRQCIRLAECILNGSAFHHAGLLPKQREAVENGFKKGTIKSISATPTLAWGVNMPAYRVVIRDMKRFSGYGSEYLPALEVHQMMGRAGRPKYDKEGEAVMVAKNRKEAVELAQRYISGPLEDIYSKLSAEPSLRIHVLSLIASEVTRTKYSLNSFFSKTFFSHQYGSTEAVMEKVEKTLKMLESFGFISSGGEKFISDEFVPAFSLDHDTKLYATPLGKRVAELCIDPLSAKHIITNMKQKSDIGYLTMMNGCNEMQPLIQLRKGDEFLDAAAEDAGVEMPDSWDVDYEDFLASLKTSLMFIDWMDEKGEDFISEKFNVTPGEIYTKMKNAEWMLYAASDIAKITGEREHATSFNRLRLRIKYGVKEELLDLVKLKGIGRVRARKLFRSGIKTTRDVRNAPIEHLEKILGLRIAKSVKQSLDEALNEKMRRFKNMSDG